MQRKSLHPCIQNNLLASSLRKSGTKRRPQHTLRAILPGTTACLPSPPLLTPSLRAASLLLSFSLRQCMQNTSTHICTQTIAASHPSAASRHKIKWVAPSAVRLLRQQALGPMGCEGAEWPDWDPAEGNSRRTGGPAGPPQSPPPLRNQPHTAPPPISRPLLLISPASSVLLGRAC